MMHGYDTFPGDVKEHCRQLMEKYNLEVVSESPVQVIFKSSRCMLKLVTEYDYVEIRFRQQEEDPWMFLGPYLRARFPDAQITFPEVPPHLSRIEKIRLSIQFKVGLINKYCIPILEGDFSWKDKYDIHAPPPQ